MGHPLSERKKRETIADPAPRAVPSGGLRPWEDNVDADEPDSA